MKHVLIQERKVGIGSKPWTLLGALPLPGAQPLGTLHPRELPSEPRIPKFTFIIPSVHLAPSILVSK